MNTTTGGGASSAAVLDWLASIGAGGAEHVAAGCGLSVGAARGRLRALEQEGLSRSSRILHGAPSLHILTRAGLRAAGRPALEPMTISASGFAHLLAVAGVAAALGGVGERVHGEQELRALERASGGPLASAEVGYAADGSRALHRPDLVCWRGDRPVAIEVELAVKAPERLRTIVRGWARSRLVDGVVYYASPHAARALARAVQRESAQGRVVVAALEARGELPRFDR